MKKWFLIGISCLFVSGCFGNSANSSLENFTKKLNKTDAYYLEGKMEIVNNEDTYEYSVIVSHKKEDFYKVELTNMSNDHEQVILRNEDGVYVVTPNLNKSFKFQSDWPYNNSQVYLIDSICDDLNNDKEMKTEKSDDGYVYTSTVNYPNNESLTKQKVFFDKDGNLSKVQVLDDKDSVQIQMEFSKIDLSATLEENSFELNKIITIDTKEQTEKQNSETDNQTSEENNSSEESETTNENSSAENQTKATEETDETERTKQTATIDDIIYPMYLPTNTYLTDQQTINTETGQRLILTFDGDNPFVLVEEVSNYAEEGLIIPVSGEIDFVADALAVVAPNSISWSSSGIDYYVASDVLDKNELLQVARSISAVPVSK